MKGFFTGRRVIVVGVLAGVTFVAGWASAQTAPILTGPRVVTLPYVYVPFLQSQLEIRQGKRNVSTGACSFSIDLRVKPGDLALGQKLARIQRAYDPDTCQELVETGIVPVPASAPVSSDLEGSNGSGGVALAPTASSPGNISAVSNQFSAFGQIAFTDGNNPVVKPFRTLTNGIEASRANASITLNTGDCVTTFPSASYAWGTRWFGYTGWSQAPGAGATVAISCTDVNIDVSANHSNSSSFPFIFDCSSTVSINYAPLRIVLDSAGGKQLVGSVTVTGDMTSCGEYLARFETLQ